MFAIDAAARRTAAVMPPVVQTRWNKRISSQTFFLGLLAGAGLTALIHMVDLVLRPLLVLLRWTSSSQQNAP
jgi:hypothetical protein